MLRDEWLLRLDDLVNTKIGMEVGLDRVKDHDGAISTSTTAVQPSFSIHH